MDRSYKLKMEEKLNNNILTIEYIVNCIAKYENKINTLAYKEKQYRNVGYNDFKVQLDKLISYRKPFVDVLINDCHISLDEIKNMIAKVKEKNIPTKIMCNKIRDMIVSGSYWLE